MRENGGVTAWWGPERNWEHEELLEGMMGIGWKSFRGGEETWRGLRELGV